MSAETAGMGMVLSLPLFTMTMYGSFKARGFLRSCVNFCVFSGVSFNYLARDLIMLSPF